DMENTLLKKNLEAASLQIEVLKAQIEVMKSYQDKFLSTVYWSLGTVAALVVFLAGFNWFTNNRSLEKESELHKNMIINELNSIKTINSQQILDLKQEITNHLTIELDSMKAKQESSNIQIKNEIEIELSKILGSKIKKLENEQASIHKNFLQLKYQSLVDQHLFGSALRVAIDLLVISENVDEYWTAKAFEKIIDTLKTAVKLNKTNFIDIDDRAKLTRAMKPFSEKYQIDIDNIYKLLTEAQN
ncbi:hypothetical protein HUN35_19970, partial [Acinetobacter bereziniae]|uniref:hypothetical protein n=3 Tax=Acinetobacter bereziniae TaxID=106648 RepID=UPI00157FE0D2